MAEKQLPSPRDLIDWLGLFVAPKCHTEHQMMLYLAVRDSVATKFETSVHAVAAVKRWMVKHRFSTGGRDNIEFLLTNLEAQIWDRVRLGRHS